MRATNRRTREEWRRWQKRRRQQREEEENGCCYAAVHNIKFHFVISSLASLSSQDVQDLFSDSRSFKEIKLYRNFIVLRSATTKLVFTIFPKSGHINASGVRKFHLLQEALDNFNNEFSFRVSLEQCVIDNSTSSGRLCAACSSYLCFSSNTLQQQQQQHNKRKISLYKLKDKVEQQQGRGEELCFSLRPHFFPGGVLRRKDKCTIITFSSGNFIVIGAKSLEEIREAVQTLCAIIRHP